MKRENTIKKFSYTLESDATLDLFSTSGRKEEINQDNFEILSNKNLSIFILADGQGEGTIGETMSAMASQRALDYLDRYQFNKKSSKEILTFLKKLFLEINHFLVNYLETAHIKNASTTLSIALIYKNSLYTAHIGESRIYVIHQDETPTLLSKDPSYNKKISKNTIVEEEKSYYLGDKSLTEDKIFVKQEANLFHKDRIFICSNNLLKTIPENKFTSKVEEIENLLQNHEPSHNATFIRYIHYERRVEVLRVHKEELYTEEDKVEIDWEKLLPLLKKVALVLGIFLMFGFLYLIFTQEPTTEHVEALPPKKGLILIPEGKIEPEILKYERLQYKQREKEELKKEPSRVEENIKEVRKTTFNPPNKITIQNEFPQREKPIKYKEKPSSTVNFLKLVLMRKADSDILYVGNNGLRITFKANKLIASQKNFFYIPNENPQKLYATLEGVNSNLLGDITDRLHKQYFAQSVTLRKRAGQLSLNIDIKESCTYKRSAWAKKSGLDLLTFSCEE